MWSAATVTCSVAPAGVMTVNVTGSVVVSSSFMLVNTTAMPCAQDVAKDTLGSTAPCSELPHALDERVNVPSSVDVALSVAVTVGCAASMSMSTTCSVPAGTETLCAASTPDGSTLTSASLL